MSAAGRIPTWRTASRDIVLNRPIVVGILNVTPDSFSDGGDFVSPQAALDQAERMIDEGVDIIDVGGESTRPGAVPIEAAAESRRVVPVIEGIRERWPDIAISIDTVKSNVAASAIGAGAEIINDVSAMRLDPEMPSLAAASRAGVILMHSRGNVADMATYTYAQYRDVGAEVMEELESQLLALEDAGVERSSIVFDPGFGFSKRGEHSMQILAELDDFARHDVPLMVGVSRKRFVSQAVTGDSSGDPHASLSLEDRDAATAAVNVLALERGAMIFRVHNVAINRNALDAAWTILKHNY
jgi:dihydropteroate synthase